MSEVKSVDAITIGSKWHLLKANDAYTVRTFCGLSPKPNKQGWTASSERINFAALIPQLRCSRCEVIAMMVRRKKELK